MKKQGEEPNTRGGTIILCLHENQKSLLSIGTALSKDILKELISYSKILLLKQGSLKRNLKGTEVYNVSSYSIYIAFQELPRPQVSSKKKNLKKEKKMRQTPKPSLEPFKLSKYVFHRFKEHVGNETEKRYCF